MYTFWNECQFGVFVSQSIYTYYIDGEESAYTSRETRMCFSSVVDRLMKGSNWEEKNKMVRDIHWIGHFLSISTYLDSQMGHKQTLYIILFGN